MKKLQKLAITAITGFALLGCASSPESLQRETAIAIGGNLSPDQITIANVDRGLSSVKWQAKTATENYDCSADDMVRSVLCTKK